VCFLSFFIFEAFIFQFFGSFINHYNSWIFITLFTLFVLRHLGVLVFVLFCWTKSLSYTVADFTGMPYQFRVFKYLEFISLIWKGPYYDKISVTSVKKECLDSKKTLQSLQLKKSRIPSLSSERPNEMPRHLSVSNINNDAFKSGVQSIFRSLLQRYVSRRF
jgi:hypothetical protein